MGFYAILSVIEKLLVHREWKLHRCRRWAEDSLHFYVTDVGHRVLTPTATQRRSGLTLRELLVWIEQTGDDYLSDSVRAMRGQVE